NYYCAIGHISGVLF
nr:immunoglobulin light chain junction region [Macaca mulatta]MOW70654.1 immunoglobulin light chain junction region [Macaca mulatta]